MDKLHADGLRFVDEQGRTRIFNGMNIQEKQGGKTRFGYDLDDAFFEKCAARGINLIRLCIVWENLEPRPGQYNESYLRSVDEVFDRAAKQGIYIFLDLHQDLYGDMGIGGGDGAPKWAQLDDGKKNRQQKVVWSENYMLSKAVRRAFDNFWANTNTHGRGLQDHFAALWAMLARRYGQHPALFGYDFLNEPFPGTEGVQAGKAIVFSIVRNIFFNPKIKTGKLVGDLLRKARRPHILDHFGGEVIRDITKAADKIAARFDLEKYSPFLNKMGAAVRRESQNGFLMMEQSVFCNGGVPMSAPAIFVGGGRDRNQCYAPHAYDLTVDTPAYKYADNSRVSAFFAVIAQTQQRLQMPVVVGEWGGGDENDPSWFHHAQFLLDFFDRCQWSQTYWCYKEGCLDAPLMAQALCRSYPQAVAGKIERYRSAQDAFELEFTQAPEDAAETLLYLHKPFAEIDCDGEWEVARYESGASIVRLRTRPGRHCVSVRF